MRIRGERSGGEGVAAVAALGYIGDAAAVPVLLEALDDAELRRAAAEALGQIGTPSVPGLLKRWAMRMRRCAAAAAAALGAIGDATAVPGLLAALDDADAEVRRAAVEALGEIGDAAAVPGLLAALGDADEVREGLRLRRWGRSAMRQPCRAAGSAARCVVVGACGNGGALGEIGDQAAVPGLLRALGDAEWEVRWAAAKALGWIGDAVAVPGLLAALRDANAYVRQAAAKALGQIGDAAAVPGLLAALRDADAGVRQAAAAALGEIGAPAVPGLLAALGDADADVRRAAAKALRNLLPTSPPHDRVQRHAWQKALAAMQRVARQQGDTDLLTAVLERQAAWNVALDPWQDPLQPPPVPAWQLWVQRIGRGGLVVLLAGLSGVATVVLAGAGDAVMAAVLPVLLAQPWWASVGLVFGLGVLATLLGWLVEGVRSRR
jgi:HEAT repeat protein